MAKNVLIATLGESPIVVTSMVKALQAQKKMTIDQLHVIHSQGEKLIGLGYDMVKEHLERTCNVMPRILPFADTNSRKTSMMFLQVLSDLIQSHEDAGDNVYLSLAGGRKNMSALMAVTCQLFECVRGLYHILDRHEDNPDRRNFHSIEALFDLEEEERYGKLSPPTEGLILVEIPYPQLANRVALQRSLSGAQSNSDAQTPIEIEGEREGFYSGILTKKENNFLDVYLSKAAHNQFQKIGGGSTKRNLMNCFRSMQYSQLLEKRDRKSLANVKTDCTPFKMGSTAERPFYYRTNGKVVVCEIASKNTTYSAILDGRKEVWSKDHPIEESVHVSDLEEDNILITPLGKSPMVVTQTFTLLSKREGANIEKVILVHPDNPEIRNGVRLLKTAFKKFKKVRFVESIKVENINDVSSYEDCRVYSERLVAVIKKAQVDNPNKNIHLSLSGGRKGMAALTFFAAQQANIDAVYHTLITDVALEKQIEEETTITALQSLTRKKKVQRLFLDAYDASNFELFRVPVIPISSGPVRTS